ncbi:endolytic transglycosylase MltG [Alloiococcus sp. CFN-8]|uniref:endolytic transglycosylase MltG n=1 Tax=Alloiococcus sp. CFN-8 TaxID=3416081 RepID=UPI003CFAD592
MGKKVITIILVFFLIALAGGIFYYNTVVNNPFSSDEEKVLITIEKEDTLYKLLGSLKEEGKIKNTALIKIYIKLNNIDGNIKPGTYEISTKDNLASFLNIISQGNEKENSIRVTIPEGFDVEKIAKTLEENGLSTYDEFINAVKGYPIPEYITLSTEKKYNLEGFLFPDTYEFKKDSVPEDIIRIMLTRFEEVLQEIAKDQNTQIPKEDIERYIIMASMIEKEAKTKEEMSTIASVIYNRLEIPMKLQIDATVIYALGEHKEILTYDDLKVISPYNTYIIDTLPIGPIASPGREAIKAALKPDTTNYIYYLYNPEAGNHYFTNDYNDFLQKKSEFGY